MSTTTTAPQRTGAKAITEDLMARLRRHYIKPGQQLAGGVFIPEVGWNGSRTNISRCDAVYVGFTSSSGQLLIGHEVKATRADWLRELEQPTKAAAWADQCHEWYLVAAPGVVKPGELPPGWGHMEPGRSRTRMNVLVPAPRKGPDHQPSWEATRSLLARQDTLTVQAALDAKAEEAERVGRLVAERQAQEEDSAAVVLNRYRERAEEATALLEEVQEALGVRVTLDRAWRDHLDMDGLRLAVRTAQADQALRTAAAETVQRGWQNPLRDARQALEQVERAYTRLAALEGWQP